jgi:hypothetical protein
MDALSDHTFVKKVTWKLRIHRNDTSSARATNGGAGDEARLAVC